MRTRTLWLSAAAAAVGLAAIGTVMAQQPAAPVELPVQTVKTASQWSSPAPPGATAARRPAKKATADEPVGGSPGRLTSPVVAGADGVGPAGGIELPPPGLDLPSTRLGAVPPETGPVAPGTTEPPLAPSSPESTLPLPGLPGAGPAAPPPSPALPLPSSTLPPAPAVPTPPAALPRSLPTASPAVPGPSSPLPAPSVAPPEVKSPAASTVPPAPPSLQPTEAAPAGSMLAGRASPSVTVETICPETVVYGQEFQYKLIVRNTGTVAVSNVKIDNELPAGSRYIGSDPTGEMSSTRLTWTLTALEAGAEKQITVRVKPGNEGEARSRATVSFSTAVDARTRVTRPRVAVTVAASETARTGDETTFQIKVTNSGSGPATKLMLQARLSDGLLHSQGQVIEAELPSLPPGETKMVPLKVNAGKAGNQWCQIAVTAEGSPDSTAKATVNVVEPMLVVKQTGPSKCVVRAEPSFTIDLSNPGTAATDPIQLHTVLPDGFECVQASDGGAATGKTVTWRLPSLAAGGNRSLTLKLRATADTGGEVPVLTIAQAGVVVMPAAGVAGGPARPRRGLEAKTESLIAAEGVAAIRFEVVGLDNPVEVGKEATYEIRVMNQGTGPCSNVQVAAALPEGTEFVSATTGGQPAKVRSQGLQLVFEPIPSLAVKGETAYRVRLRGAVAGDLRFRVQLTCDQLKTPLLKEESTRFYKQQ